MNKKIRHLSLFLVFGLSTLIAQQQRVGINTETPEATLDVNGNMIIRKIADFNEKSSAITWNPTTGAISTGRGYEEVNYKFASYTVTAYNGSLHQYDGGNYDQDYIDFDTKIPVSKYDIFLTGGNPESGWDALPYQQVLVQGDKVGYHKKIGIGYVHGLNNIKRPVSNIYHTDNDYHEIIPVPLKFTVPNTKTKTWHIIMDFAGAKPKGHREFWNSYGSLQWNFEILIVPKKLAKRAVIEGEVNDLGIGGLSSNPLQNSVDNSNLHGSIEANYVQGVGKVNINNPKKTHSTLNIGGDLNIRKMASPTKKSIRLRRNNDTGELIKESNNKKPFIALTYHIETNKDAGVMENRDLIARFDTKIPKDKFYLTITSASLVEKDSGKADVGITSEKTGGSGLNALKVAVASDHNSPTWTLRADYINAGPNFQRQATPIKWVINVLLFAKDDFLDLWEYTDEDGVRRNYDPAKDEDINNFLMFGWGGGRGRSPVKTNGVYYGNPLSADESGRVNGNLKLVGIEYED